MRGFFRQPSDVIIPLLILIGVPLWGVIDGREEWWKAAAIWWGFLAVLIVLAVVLRRLDDWWLRRKGGSKDGPTWPKWEAGE